jgi:hypothetical protein
MFGLEDRKRGKAKRPPEEIYDLELEIADPVKGKKLKDQVEKRIQELKQILRTGEQKAEFEQYGILLHGYAALHRLITRLSRKK